MKKMVMVMCMVLVFMSGISLMAYGVNKDTTTMNDVDFTQKLTVNKDNNSGCKAKFEYNPDGQNLAAYGTSRSAVYLNAGQYGYAASTTYAPNNESVHKYWGGQATSASYYYSPYATISGYKYAKKLYFYGDFRTSVNNISTIFELNCN